MNSCLSYDFFTNVQWASLNSASKYAEEFGPIKWESNKWDYLTWAGKELCPGKSGPIKQDAQLSRGQIKQAPLYWLQA